MERVFNFSAGPSMLPLPVLERVAAEMVNYGESGMSVTEMSHRSPDFEPIIQKAEADLRKLMNIPDNYAVMFLQGGASTQFAAVPLNLMPEGGKADYVVSGQFSGKAYKEAFQKAIRSRVAADAAIWNATGKVVIPSDALMTSLYMAPITVPSSSSQT